jgi:autotransporter-associated beta strand protein
VDRRSTVNAGTSPAAPEASAEHRQQRHRRLLDQTGSTSSFTGVISGTGSVVKFGSGVSLMNAGQTYTGATTVNAGTLGVSGSVPGSGAIVNAGGTLLTRAGGASGQHAHPSHRARKRSPSTTAPG